MTAAGGKGHKTTGDWQEIKTQHNGWFNRSILFSTISFYFSSARREKHQPGSLEPSDMSAPPRKQTRWCSAAGWSGAGWTLWRVCGCEPTKAQLPLSQSNQCHQLNGFEEWQQKFFKRSYSDSMKRNALPCPTKKEMTEPNILSGASAIKHLTFLWVNLLYPAGRTRSLAVQSYRDEHVLLQGSAPESQDFVLASENLKTCFHISSKRRERKCE